MSSRTVDNMADVIDSRDVIERIDYLTDVIDRADEIDEDDVSELAVLKALAEEGESLADWTHGVAIIRESYFTDYCQDMLDDCGDLPKDLPSYLVIDWEATAHNLRMDYTEIEFDGITYLAR